MPGTRSSEPVPWPPAWHDRPATRYYLALGVIGVFLVLLPVLMAVSMYGEGKDATGHYLLGFSAIGTLVSWLGFETRMRLRRSGAGTLATAYGDDNTSGVKIPYSIRVYVSYILTMGAIAAFFAIAAVHTFVGAEAGSRGVGFVWSAVALLFASFVVRVATGRFARGYLLVSPNGIHQRGWTFESFLPWSGIIGISAVQTDSPDILVLASDDTPWHRRQVTRLWRQDKLPTIASDNGLDVKPAIHIEGKFLSSDPALVMELLTYYAEHPEARAELGTEAALQRARTAAFA